MTLALEVSQILVKVVPVRGEPQDMSFFLRPVGGRFETLGERLNDPGATFVPVAIDGETEFLRLRSIAHIEIGLRLPEISALEELGASRNHVSVRLLSGQRFDGALIYLLPPESSRVSDYLNSETNSFVLLDLGETCLYIHRDAIERIRPQAKAPSDSSDSDRP